MSYPNILKIVSSTEYKHTNIFKNPPLNESVFHYFYGEGTYEEFGGPNNNSSATTSQSWNVLTLAKTKSRAAQIAIQNYMTGSGQNMYFRCRHVDNSDYSQWQDWKQLTAKTDLLNWVYPVGSIYMSVNNVSPATFLGGTWEQIQNRFLLSAGSSYAAGSTGGEASHTLSVAETPAHTHTRGTMEISGKVHAGYPGVAWGHIHDATGAFNRIDTQSNVYSTGAANQTNMTGFDFYASRTWTGATSSVGGNAAHNNMPPYLTVYMWKRIS